jgi:protein O-GlcNAc transferase
MELNIEQLMQQGVAAHKEGKLEEAERLYRAVIQLQPLHPHANHNLGAVVVSRNKVDVALPLFKTALEANPKIEQFWLSYIDALTKENQLNKAKQVLQQARNQGVAGENLNVLEKHLVLIVQASKSAFTEQKKNLTLSEKRKKLAEQKKQKKAKKKNLKAISPSQEQLTSLLQHYQNGRFDDAEKLSLSITQEFPKHQFGWKVLGAVLKQTGRVIDSLTPMQKSVQLVPQDAEAHNNLGAALLELGRLEEAEVSLRQAIVFKPDYAEAHYNWGAALIKLGRLEEAEVSLRQAIVFKPDYAEAHCNWGAALIELGRLEEAEVRLRQAIVYKPDYAEAYCNWGNTLVRLGRLEEALARYDEAIELQVDYSLAYSNKNLCLNYSSNWSSQFIYHQHLEFEKQFGGLRVRVPLMARVKKSSGERLRIGYVSGDFRSHSVAYFFEPLLQHHNANVVETFCYYNHRIVDDVTNRLMAVSEHWRSIVDNSHSNTVDRIIADKIDILVDLSGHTADNSLLVFVQKPAPILVTWLGSSNTTGLSAIDYRFTDVIADPVGETDQFHSEVLFRLPNGFHCYRGNETALVNVELPHNNRGHITFGSFNNISKLTPEIIKVWSKILNAVPQSQLLLKNSMVTQNISHYAQLFKQEGISEDRIEYYGRLPSNHEHLELYGAIDIGLDPFPYNGVTTTCEALWMGVPVISLAGDRHAGRVGASILTNVGLTDFIAQDIDGYIQLAVEMAANPTYLQEIRRGLRKRMLDSPLCDARSFASDIEKAYQDMWCQYLK